MVVLQAISTGLSEALRFLQRGGDYRLIVAVDARRRPAGSLEALHLIDRIGERQRTVDRDAVVVEQHDQFRKLESPASAMASWLMPSIRSPSVGDDVGLMIDNAAEHGGHMPFGDRHADRVGEALSERAGGGLDAAVWPNSG